MSDEMVKYDDRYVPKQGFRAYIYGYDNQKLLVNSWEEYQKEISSGLWYPKISDVPQKEKLEKKGTK